MNAVPIVSRSLVLLLASTGFSVVVRGQDPDRQQQQSGGQPISVSAFTKIPIGYLGVPLGTVVRVSGEVFNGDETGWKADAGKTLLRVNKVDGKKLEQPVHFEFLRARDSVKKPAIGETFNYYAHEYGAFDGVVTLPKELGIQDPSVAHDGFHYRRGLTVHASIPVEK